MKVSFRVKQVFGIEASANAQHFRFMIVDVEMTRNQCKHAILDLMNHDGEQAVFEWFKGAFPEWFEVKA